MIRRVFPHPRERVFSAFATAESMQQWFSPSREIKTQVIDYDFRVGGQYRLRFELPDGSEVGFGGRFEVVQPPSRLSYSWCWEEPDPHAGFDTQVTIEFHPSGGGTEVIVFHERLQASGMAARHASGWEDTMDRLAWWTNTQDDPSHSP